MKRFLTFLSFCAFLLGAKAQIAADAQPIHLQFRTNMSWDDSSHSVHRTPPQIPNIYFDASTSTVYFENPCYECTLELVVPGTDTVAYSYIIPDGDDTVSLPTFLSGMYELHIHRGNYCFWGVIELD